MSHVDTSPLSAYNSLSDRHLSGYFANTRMRNHLRKSGLVTRRGQIVPASTYRLNMARKEHKKHVKELLAQAIVHKTLDLERHRQVAIRQKLEEIAKIELVQRVRAERKQHPYVEAILPLLTPCDSPRPSSSPRPSPSRTTRSVSPRSACSERDIIVEERIQYVDDNGNAVDMPEFERSTSRGRSRTPRSREEIDSRHLYSLNPVALRRYATTLARMEHQNAMASPYLMPQMPIPPSTPRVGTRHHSGRRQRSTSSEKSPKRGTGYDLHRSEPAMRHQGQLQSMCEVKMKYHGWALHLAREQMDPRQEVVVEQQHCGGNTLTVYKDLLLPGSTFTFTSHRHRGYPFSLTLYVDGRQDARVSTCCEFGHKSKVRLGGKQGHFSIVSVDGLHPCYKCQVQKGLKGKKAPPRKMKRVAKEAAGEEVLVVEVEKTESDKKVKDKEAGEDEEDSDEYESDFEDEDGESGSSSSSEEK